MITATHNPFCQPTRSGRLTASASTRNQMMVSGMKTKNSQNQSQAVMVDLPCCSCCSLTAPAHPQFVSKRRSVIGNRWKGGALAVCRSWGGEWTRPGSRRRERVRQRQVFALVPLDHEFVHRDHVVPWQGAD